jgi:hypothetical protein
MVRRRGSVAVEKGAPGQRRLDDAFSEDPEAKAEREYRELRGGRATTGPPPAPAYDERVSAWFQDRERAMRRRRDPLVVPDKKGKDAADGGGGSASPPA